MALTLRELEAEFVKYLDDKRREIVPTLAEADGIWYLCPACFEANRAKGGDPAVGCHSILNWFRGRVADDVRPGPGRWTPTGTGIDDLTYVPGNPQMAISVQVQGDCNAHFHIRDGKIC